VAKNVENVVQFKANKEFLREVATEEEELFYVTSEDEKIKKALEVNE